MKAKKTPRNMKLLEIASSNITALNFSPFPHIFFIPFQPPSKLTTLLAALFPQGSRKNHSAIKSTTTIHIAKSMDFI